MSFKASVFCGEMTNKYREADLTLLHMLSVSGLADLLIEWLIE